MSKYFCFLFALLLVGCNSEKTSENTDSDAFDFSYTIDTVIVDSKEEIIFLNWDLETSAISLDGKYLYNYDHSNTAIQFIDLENLVFEKLLPIEKEGPNGLGGNRVYHIYAAENDHLILTDSYHVAMIDLDGNKSMNFQYDKFDFKGKKLPETMRITSQESVSHDGSTLITTYGDLEMKNAPSGLAFFELEKRVFSHIPIAIFSELQPYLFRYYLDGNLAGMNQADTYLIMKNDSLIITSSAFNKINFYHFSTDSITTKTFQSKLTSNSASSNYPKETHTRQELLEVGKTIENEVDFGPLLFDEENQVYWRFSKEMDRMIEDSIVFKTVLTAFDSNFDHMQEKLLSSDFQLPRKYFIRNGMIYTFLNIDDELAFVRLKPTISYE